MFWDAHKNRLIETILLSTQNGCFGWEIWVWFLSMHSYLEVWHFNIPYLLVRRAANVQHYKYGRRTMIKYALFSGGLTL